MNRYEIYCTKEQTKKAFDLGAPIITTPFFSQVIYEVPTFFVKDDLCYWLPTAEQMINWLEEQGKIDSIEMTKSSIVNEKGEWQYSIWDKSEMWDCGGHGFTSRQKATLAAIDAALEYLSNNKK